MLVLTLRQPWAWLIIHGPKNIENRSWRPGKALGQRIAIHAGLRIDPAGYKLAKRLGLAPPPPGEIARGAIIGTVDVSGCVTESASPWFAPGSQGWQLEAPEPCAPIPARGRLGLWSTDAFD